MYAWGTYILQTSKKQNITLIDHEMGRREVICSLKSSLRSDSKRQQAPGRSFIFSCCLLLTISLLSQSGYVKNPTLTSRRRHIIYSAYIGIWSWDISFVGCWIPIISDEWLLLSFRCLQGLPKLVEKIKQIKKFILFEYFFLDKFRTQYKKNILF